jgi:acetyl esterase/lipase
MKSPELQRAREWETRFGQANAAAAGLDEVRRVNDEWQRERAGELPADLQVERVDAAGVPAEWIKVEAATSGPVVLFLHGGGFMLGSARENHEWLARLSRATRGRILALEYRLAPEAPYPAQRDDALTAYEWLLAEGHDPAGVALVGESSGGGLVAALLPAIRAAGSPMPAAAAMTSPFVDWTLSAQSLEDNDDPFVHREILAMMVDAVLQGEDARAQSPLFGDFTGLPPLLIQVGTAEAVRDDARRLSEAALAAGVDVTYEAWEDMIHLWHGFPYLPEAVQAVERIAEFVREHAA